MKVVRKRILAFLLTFVMVLTLMPALGVSMSEDVYASDMVHNFTTDGMTDADGFYTFAGNSKNVTASYGNTSMTKALKMDSSGKVTFKASGAGTLTLVYPEGNAGVTFYINTDKVTIPENGVLEHKITAAGDVEIAKGKGKGESHLCYISFVPNGGGTGSGGGDSDVPITAVTIAPSDVVLTVGETAKLTASVEPATTTQSKEIKWTSSDESVATVSDDGTVTAKQPGGAIITATSAANDTISASCTITVSAGTGGDVLITGVTIDRQNAALKVGETMDLKASVTPSNTTQSKEITWTSSDANVATVDNNGKVTAVSDGTVTITAASAANSSFSASCKVVVTTNGGSTGQGNMTAGGWNETIYAQIAGISKADVTGVSYSGTMSGTLTGDDFTYLVRDLNGGFVLIFRALKQVSIR